jgi:S-DNA-T family DNA segregation ATPase FtsK/SpoIIIE
MPATDRAIDVSLWGDDWRGAIRRRLRECGGIALITLAVTMGCALATWSVQDPSLSHATDAPVRNLLGATGAIGSDLLMQLLGLASTVLVLPVAVWGWRIATHREFDREWQRLLLWLGGTLLASGFASCLPKTPKWPLPTGLGGVIGDAMLRVPAFLLGPLSGVHLIAIAIVLGGASLFAIIVAAGFAWRSTDPTVIDERWARKAAGPIDDDEERASISLGRLVHGFLSLKARIGRWLARREMPEMAWQAPPVTVKPGDRIAPTFDAPKANAREEVDDIEEEEDDAPVKPRKPARVRTPKRSGGYQLPSLNLLAAARAIDRFAPSQESIQETAVALEKVLQDFGVRGEIINARPGPVVTLYELEPAPGIKSSRVIGLADDIARSMSALSARVAVVSGRNVIGIELPNDRREKVYFREMLDSDDYTESQAKLPLCLGKTIGGEPVVVDLARMPHLLIAGTTGSGKSVAINTMILSLLYRLTPEQ